MSADSAVSGDGSSQRRRLDSGGRALVRQSLLRFYAERIGRVPSLQSDLLSSAIEAKRQRGLRQQYTDPRRQESGMAYFLTMDSDGDSDDSSGSEGGKAAAPSATPSEAAQGPPTGRAQSGDIADLRAPLPQSLQDATEFYLGELHPTAAFRAEQYHSHRLASVSVASQKSPAAGDGSRAVDGDIPQRSSHGAMNKPDFEWAEQSHLALAAPIGLSSTPGTSPPAGLPKRTMDRLKRLRRTLDRRADYHVESLRSGSIEAQADTIATAKAESAASQAALLAAAEFRPMASGVALHGHSRLRSVMLALEEDRQDTTTSMSASSTVATDPRSTASAGGSEEGTGGLALAPARSNAPGLSDTMSLSEPDSDRSAGPSSRHPTGSRLDDGLPLRARRKYSTESQSSASSGSAKEGGIGDGDGARSYRDSKSAGDVDMVLGRHRDWQLRLWPDTGLAKHVDVFSDEGSRTHGAPGSHGKQGRGKAAKKKVKGARRRERDRRAAERAQQKLRDYQREREREIQAQFGTLEEREAIAAEQAAEEDARSRTPGRRPSSGLGASSDRRSSSVGGGSATPGQSPAARAMPSPSPPMLGVAVSSLPPPLMLSYQADDDLDENAIARRAVTDTSGGKALWSPEDRVKQALRNAKNRRKSGDMTAEQRKADKKAKRKAQQQRRREARQAARKGSAPDEASAIVGTSLVAPSTGQVDADATEAAGDDLPPLGDMAAALVAQATEGSAEMCDGDDDARSAASGPLTPYKQRRRSAGGKKGSAYGKGKGSTSGGGRRKSRKHAKRAARAQKRGRPEPMRNEGMPQRSQIPRLSSDTSAIPTTKGVPADYMGGTGIPRALSSPARTPSQSHGRSEAPPDPPAPPSPALSAMSEPDDSGSASASTATGGGRISSGLHRDGKQVVLPRRDGAWYAASWVEEMPRETVHGGTPLRRLRAVVAFREGSLALVMPEDFDATGMAKPTARSQPDQLPPLPPARVVRQALCTMASSMGAASCVRFLDDAGELGTAEEQDARAREESSAIEVAAMPSKAAARGSQRKRQRRRSNYRRSQARRTSRSMSGAQALLAVRHKMIRMGVPLRSTDVAACSLDAWHEELRGESGYPFDDLSGRFAEGVPRTVVVQPELTQRALVDLLSRREQKAQRRQGGPRRHRGQEGPGADGPTEPVAGPVTAKAGDASGPQAETPAVPLDPGASVDQALDEDRLACVTESEPWLHTGIRWFERPVGDVRAGVAFVKALPAPPGSNAGSLVFGAIGKSVAVWPVSEDGTSSHGADVKLSTCYRDHRAAVTCIDVVRDWVITPFQQDQNLAAASAGGPGPEEEGAWVANVAQFGTDSGEALRSRLGGAMRRKRAGNGARAPGMSPYKSALGKYHGHANVTPAANPLVVSGDMAGHVHVWMPVGPHGGRIATLFLSIGAQGEGTRGSSSNEPVTAVAVNSRLIAAGGAHGTLGIWARKRHPREFAPVPVIRKLQAHTIVRSLALPSDPRPTPRLPLWTSERGIDEAGASYERAPGVAPVLLSGGGAGRVSLWVVREEHLEGEPAGSRAESGSGAPSDGGSKPPSRYVAEEKALQSHDARVTCLAIDSYRAISAGADGACRVYDVFGHYAGRVLGTVRVPPPQGASVAAERGLTQSAGIASAALGGGPALALIALGTSDGRVLRCRFRAQPQAVAHLLQGSAILLSRDGRGESGESGRRGERLTDGGALDHRSSGTGVPAGVRPAGGLGHAPSSVRAAADGLLYRSSSVEASIRHLEEVHGISQVLRYTSLPF